MFRPEPERGPSTAFEWVVTVVFLAVFIGLLVVEICINYSPIKLAAALIIAFWIPLLALHEGGHAIAAFLVGWRVKAVCIGMGKVMHRFQVGTATVEIRLIPIEGFVRCIPTKLRRPHLESAFIYFAGPGIELLLAFCILCLIGSDRLFTHSNDYSLIVWQSLALAAASQAILNLIPFALETQGGTTYSDGLGLIVSFLRQAAYYEQLIDESRNGEKTEWQPYEPRTSGSETGSFAVYSEPFDRDPKNS